MKVKVESYKIVCDHCWETFENGAGVVCWTEDIDGPEICNEALAAGWREINGKHYCPNCWQWERMARDGLKMERR